jgi:hypothetical protein
VHGEDDESEGACESTSEDSESEESESESGSSSEATETDEESESESEFEPEEPTKKKQKRTRDKKGKLRRTPEQYKKRRQNKIDKTRKAYAKQKDKSAYTDKTKNLVRQVFERVSVVRDDMMFTMDKQLADLIPRVKTERLTYNTSGVLVVQGGSSTPKNKVNRMVVKAITEKLSDSDKRLAAAFLRLPIVPEHATPNKVNYTGEKDSGCYSIVTDSTNTRFQDGHSSKYPGVSWHKPTKKWRVRICSFPGEKGREKHRGLFDSERDAFKCALKVWDAGYADEKHAPHRSAIIFYNKNGVLEPHFKVFQSFTAITKFLRPSLFPGMEELTAYGFTRKRRFAKKKRKASLKKYKQRKLSFYSATTSGTGSNVGGCILGSRVRNRSA